MNTFEPPKNGKVERSGQRVAKPNGERAKPAPAHAAGLEHRQILAALRALKRGDRKSVV